MEQTEKSVNTAKSVYLRLDCSGQPDNEDIKLQVTDNLCPIVAPKVTPLCMAATTAYVTNSSYLKEKEITTRASVTQPKTQ